MISLVAGLLANLVLPFIGGPILRLFGSTYAEHAAATLVILVLTVFPLIIKDHFVSLSRIDRALARATAMVTAGGVMELVGASIGAHVGGLYGLGLGWALVIWIQAAVMLPTVYRAVVGARRQHSRLWLRPAAVEVKR
jgi:hypothetical protein